MKRVISHFVCKTDSLFVRVVEGPYDNETVLFEILVAPGTWSESIKKAEEFLKGLE